jgi:hypothetical protein
MFSFFKRSNAEPSSLGARPRREVMRSSRNPVLEAREPLPLPQVTEGNEDSDWALWEDSVLEQDSQLHSQFHDTVPSELPPELHAELGPNADPFAKVGKNAA